MQLFHCRIGVEHAYHDLCFFFVFASGHPTNQKNCDRQTHTIYNYWDVCVCARVRDAHIRLKRGVRRLARVCVLVSDGECM